MNGTQAVQHHGVFISLRPLLLVCERFAMRPVMNASWMQSRPAGLDIVFTEKVAVVIEDELVVIRIPVKEWHSQRVVVLFEWARHEAAHHSPLSHKRCVSAGRQ